MASPPASKRRRHAPSSPTTAATASPLPLAAAVADPVRVHGGRRRESGTGDEDDGEIDEMLEALGIPDSDKKRKKQQIQQQQHAIAQVIELITPPRVSRARPVCAGATSVISIDDEDDDTAALLDGTALAIEGREGDRRRESIVDLTSPGPNAEESAVRMLSSPAPGLSVQAGDVSMMATGTIAPQQVRRTILIATTLEDKAQELTSSLPASPAMVTTIERTRPRQATSPKTPNSDRECDAMLEDLLLTRPLAERISAARGRDGSSTTRNAVDKEKVSAEQIARRVVDREATIAQGGGFLYSSFSSTTVRASAGPRKPETATTVTTLSETLDFRLSANCLEDAFPNRPAVETITDVSAKSRQQTASDTLQKRARAASPAPKASKSKQEPVIVVVRMERTLHDSEAGQVLKRALQTHVYNNKPLVFELGSAFDCMHTNVIQWKRQERAFATRSKGVGGPSSSAVFTASSVCRFLSTAIYFQAEDFIQLLHQQSYTEVLSIMQFLKKEMQAQATQEQRRQSSFQADAESNAVQLSTFLIIEGMDKCLINLKKNRKASPSTSQGPEFSFSDIHEMAFQLFMDTETHTKFTVDLDSTASYVALVTREIVIAAAKKTAQEDFLESVPRLHSFRVTSTGATMNNFANSWLRMLQMIPGVSEDKAQSILDHFPTFSSLMLAYSDPNVSQEVKEDLLATKLSGKNVGRAISKRIFNVFCVDDPDALI